MYIPRSLLAFLMVLFTLTACHRNAGRQQGTSTREYKESLLKANKGLVDLDQQRIATYVDRMEWDMQTTETGLWYQLVEKTAGEQATINKVAHLNYQVSLLDGTVCYSSDSLGVKTFKISQGGVETGLEEAILLMKTGEKARFIMPPYLAHGLVGDEDKIPPRSIIVYHVELLKLTE